VSARTRTGVLVGCVVALLLTAWYLGVREPPSSAGSPTGTVRLGPEPGEDVAAYLARVPATLPPPGVAVPALVQLAEPVTAAEAVATVAGTTPRTAVFRVSLPRVQTALRFVGLEPGVPIDIALDSARVRAEQAAGADAGRLPGRVGAVAAVEATELASPSCRCVLALLVDADGAALAAVATRPGVRAVEGAPAGTVEPALSPLLPEQARRVEPVPDDGPVPAS
jgi:hypothetical protein